MPFDPHSFSLDRISRTPPAPLVPSERASTQGLMGLEFFRLDDQDIDRVIETDERFRAALPYWEARYLGDVAKDEARAARTPVTGRGARDVGDAVPVKSATERARAGMAAALGLSWKQNFIDFVKSQAGFRGWKNFLAETNRIRGELEADPSASPYVAPEDIQAWGAEWDRINSLPERERIAATKRAKYAQYEALMDAASFWQQAGAGIGGFALHPTFQFERWATLGTLPFGIKARGLAGIGKAALQGGVIEYGVTRPDEIMRREVQRQLAYSVDAEQETLDRIENEYNRNAVIAAGAGFLLGGFFKGVSEAFGRPKVYADDAARKAADDNFRQTSDDTTVPPSAPPPAQISPPPIERPAPPPDRTMTIIPEAEVAGVAGARRGREITGGAKVKGAEDITLPATAFHKVAPEDFDAIVADKSGVMLQRFVDDSLERGWRDAVVFDGEGRVIVARGEKPGPKPPAPKVESDPLQPKPVVKSPDPAQYAADSAGRESEFISRLGRAQDTPSEPLALLPNDNQYAFQIGGKLFSNRLSGDDGAKSLAIARDVYNRIAAAGNNPPPPERIFDVQGGRVVPRADLPPVVVERMMKQYSTGRTQKPLADGGNPFTKWLNGGEVKVGDLADTSREAVAKQAELDYGRQSSAAIAVITKKADAPVPVPTKEAAREAKYGANFARQISAAYGARAGDYFAMLDEIGEIPDDSALNRELLDFAFASNADAAARAANFNTLREVADRLPESAVTRERMLSISLAAQKGDSADTIAKRIEGVVEKGAKLDAEGHPVGKDVDGKPVTRANVRVVEKQGAVVIQRADGGMPPPPQVDYGAVALAAKKQIRIVIDKGQKLGDDTQTRSIADSLPIPVALGRWAKDYARAANEGYAAGDAAGAAVQKWLDENEWKFAKALVVGDKEIPVTKAKWDAGDFDAIVWDDAKTDQFIDELLAQVGLTRGDLDAPVPKTPVAPPRTETDGAKESIMEDLRMVGLPHEAVVATNVKLSSIKVDPSRFQQRQDVISGSGGLKKEGGLETQKRWNPGLSQVITVWVDRNGQRWLADGHQRLGLAKRLKQDSFRVVDELHEVDGWSADLTFVYVAWKNLNVESDAGWWDAANFARRVDQATDPRVPKAAEAMRSGLKIDALQKLRNPLAIGESVAKLEDSAFNGLESLRSVLRGRGAQIKMIADRTAGRWTPEIREASQRKLIEYAARKRKTDAEITQRIQTEIENVNKRITPQGETQNLLGHFDEVREDIIADARTDIAGALDKAIRADAKLLSTAARRGVIEKVKEFGGENVDVAALKAEKMSTDDLADWLRLVMEQDTGPRSPLKTAIADDATALIDEVGVDAWKALNKKEQAAKLKPIVDRLVARIDDFYKGVNDARFATVEAAPAAQKAQMVEKAGASRAVTQPEQATAASQYTPAQKAKIMDARARYEKARRDAGYEVEDSGVTPEPSLVESEAVGAMTRLLSVLDDWKSKAKAEGGDTKTIDAIAQSANDYLARIKGAGDDAAERVLSEGLGVFDFAARSSAAFDDITTKVANLESSFWDTLGKLREEAKADTPEARQATADEVTRGAAKEVESADTIPRDKDGNPIPYNERTADIPESQGGLGGVAPPKAAGESVTEVGRFTVRGSDGGGWSLWEGSRLVGGNKSYRAALTAAMRASKPGSQDALTAEKLLKQCSEGSK